MWQVCAFSLRRLFPCMWLILIALPAWSQRAKDPKDALDALVFRKPETWLTSHGQPLAQVRTLAPSVMAGDFDRFNAASGGNWSMTYDPITGKAQTLEGGTPWIPGTGMGNTLTAADLGVSEYAAATNRVPVSVVSAKAMEFLKTYPGLFGVDPNDLQLMADASGPMLDYLYYLNYQWTYHGIPVENARMGFYLNSGNLVLVGQEYICDTIRKLDPKPYVTKDVAWEILWGYLGKPLPGDQIVESGKLLIQPLSNPAVLSGARLTPGQGLEYRLVYVLAFRRPGVLGTWEARVDAHTGEILSFKDENKYGHIQGGTYKTDKNPTQTEVTMPFPFADYSGTAYADAAGNFTGTVGTSTMTGRASGSPGGVDIVDTCGAISLAADVTGLIDFGSSAGTDCTTPGKGGAGNTHAARTQYWNVTEIKIKAWTYLTGNGWLSGRLTDNVNLNQTCNAYWNGTSVNFFRSGGGCNNTGELPGVSLHEWGHGMDSNDGNGSSPDGGTGECYGDTTAFLQTHQSCLGGGFLGGNCGGYGNACTNCTGVREADYAKHTSPTPATPLGFNQVNCGAAACVGPCNKECHCEDAPGIQANWDLAVRDLTAAPYNLDAATAWQYLDKFWYASAPNRAGAFVCGNNNSSAVGNLFNQYRVVDDCDGNLANGTPHAAAIWAAFNRHQIGNSAAVNTDNNCGCATLATPVLSGAPGNAQATLNWGAVAGAASYDVYRNETSCTAGYTKVGNTTALTFTDTPLANGVTYYYVIQAKGTGSCPPSAMSNCVTLTPSPCTTPGVPTIGTVTVPGLNQLRVSWTAGTPAGATYKIYRALGACPGGTYSLLASGVTASPYTDGTVSGTVTYSYKVSAVDSTGGCESAQSGCASGTATGTCNAPPNFAGLASVTNPANATCTLNLSWAAGSSNCAGTVSYNVYRSTTSPFTPAPANRIAAGVATTTYSDTNGLVNGTTYYYIVRAVDSANGVEDANTVTQSGAPTGPLTTGTWTDDGGDTGAAKLTATPTWTNAATGGRTAPKCYATGTYTNNMCAAVTTPVLNVAAGGGTLTFWSKYDIENNWDKGQVELSTNGGTTWARLTVTTYPLNVTNTGDACAFPAGQTYFSGTNLTYASYTATLPAGASVMVRWNLSSDVSVTGTGWWIDDISITNVAIPGTCTTGAGAPPPEVSPGSSSATAQSWAVDKTTMSWQAATGATGYRLYRGTPGNLPNLLTATTDSCTRYDGALLTFNLNGVNDQPAAGSFLWFLVTAYNGAGEGTAGNATAGPRTLNSTGVCP